MGTTTASTQRNFSRKKISRRKQTTKRTGLSWSTIRRMELAGDFPQRVRVGKRGVGHFDDEIDEWLENRERVVIEGEE